MPPKLIARAVTLAVAVVVATSGAWWLIVRHRDQQDCAQVRAIVDYDRSQRRVSQAWADRLKAYAATITDPQRALHARRLADDAQRAVALMERSEPTVPVGPGRPPGYFPDLVNLNRQSAIDQEALDKDCPA